MRRLVPLLLCVPLLALAAGCGTAPIAVTGVEAQDPKASEQSQEPGYQKREWRPPAPAPAPGESDWIKLKSGEWLRGDLVVMRRDYLEFDSDELDNQEFDWEDIAQVRSTRVNTIALDRQQTISGTVWVRDDVVVIGTPTGEHRLRRSDVLGIVPSFGGAETLWRGDLSVGLTSQTGNTEQATANGQLRAFRRTAFSRVGINYVGNFGRTDGIDNVNNHRASGRGDIFISRRWFLIPLSVDYYRDPFQNVAHRVTPGVGAGYYMVDESTMEWSASLAGGVRFDTFDSVQPGEPDDNAEATLLAKTLFDWNITKDLELTLDYSLEATANSGANHHTIFKVSVDLLADLDLDVTVQWDRIGDPQEDANGNRPERDDLRTSIGLGWDF